VSDYVGDPETEEALERPWWGNPLIWLAISAVFLLLGLFVFPHFFGGIFLVFPFLWISPRRSRRRRRPAPRPQR
jgi:hypothetical protein